MVFLTPNHDIHMSQSFKRDSLPRSSHLSGGKYKNGKLN
jgi:hypothetical protein